MTAGEVWPAHKRDPAMGCGGGCTVKRVDAPTRPPSPNGPASPPKIMLTEYRQRFADYIYSINDDGYQRCRSQKGLRGRVSIFSEQRDLFTLSCIDELRRGEGEASAREKPGWQRMLVFAIDGYLASAVLEIEVEILRLMGDLRVQADPTPIDELLGARTEEMTRAAQALGYADVTSLRAQLDGVDYQLLVRTGRRLLAATEKMAYRSAERVIKRELRQSSMGLTREALATWGQLAEARSHLSNETRRIRYSDLCAGLGFRVDQQVGTEYFEVKVRPAGRSGPGEWPDEQLVWALRVPGLIKAGFLSVDGRYGERAFWQMAGATQMAAWTSADLPVEYRHQAGPADAALPLAWGMLFEHLLLDARWLAIPFGYADTHLFREGMAAVRLFEIRQAAAQLIFEYEYLTGLASGRAAERYRELLLTALLADVDPSDFLRAMGRIRGSGCCPLVSPIGTRPLAAAGLLRAAAFESQCQEHLRSSYGLEWWKNRRAGDSLIDLWNTGYRYRPEELAPMAGFGTLEYEQLIAAMVEGG